MIVRSDPVKVTAFVGAVTTLTTRHSSPPFGA
jgi:hypothetical protein